VDRVRYGQVLLYKQCNHQKLVKQPSTKVAFEFVGILVISVEKSLGFEKLPTRENEQSRVVYNEVLSRSLHVIKALELIFPIS
jgi:hypothetical protein